MKAEIVIADVIVDTQSLYHLFTIQEAYFRQQQKTNTTHLEENINFYHEVTKLEKK